MEIQLPGRFRGNPNRSHAPDHPQYDEQCPQHFNPRYCVVGRQVTETRRDCQEQGNPYRLPKLEAHLVPGKNPEKSEPDQRANQMNRMSVKTSEFLNVAHRLPSVD